MVVVTKECLPRLGAFNGLRPRLRPLGNSKNVQTKSAPACAMPPNASRSRTRCRTAPDAPNFPVLNAPFLLVRSKCSVATSTVLHCYTKSHRNDTHCLHQLSCDALCLLPSLFLKTTI